MLQEMFKKRPQNLCFFIRGACFYHEKSEPLIIKEFGQGFYAVLSFTGQQYYLYTHFGKANSSLLSNTRNHLTTHLSLLKTQKSVVICHIRVICVQLLSDE